MPGNSYHCWWKGHTILERYEHKDKLISKKKKDGEKKQNVSTQPTTTMVSVTLKEKRRRNEVLVLRVADKTTLFKINWENESGDTSQLIRESHITAWAHITHKSESYSANKFWIATYESWANWTDGPFTPALYSLLISFIHSFLNLCYSPDLHTVMEAQDFFPFILKWKTRFVHF